MMISQNVTKFVLKKLKLTAMNHRPNSTDFELNSYIIPSIHWKFGSDSEMNGNMMSSECDDIFGSKESISHPNSAPFVFTCGVFALAMMDNSDDATNAIEFFV